MIGKPFNFISMDGIWSSVSENMSTIYRKVKDTNNLDALPYHFANMDAPQKSITGTKYNRIIQVWRFTNILQFLHFVWKSSRKCIEKVTAQKPDYIVEQYRQCRQTETDLWGTLQWSRSW